MLKKGTPRFMDMIEQGFRVYDCIYAVEGVSGYNRISILSQRYLPPEACYRMLQSLSKKQHCMLFSQEKHP